MPLHPCRRLPWASLRRRTAAIKLCLALFCAGTAADADAGQSCPPLQISAVCGADGTALLNLQAGAEAPPGLSYLVSLPQEDIGAMSLAPGSRLTVKLASPSGQQVTVAVVGLEPAGADFDACCLSNQRVHLPTSCATGQPAPPDAPLDAPFSAPGDLAVDLSLSPRCERQRTAPVCSGRLTVTGSGQDPAPVTLSADLGTTLRAAGADCTAFAGGLALCQVPLAKALSFDLSLSPDTPRGPTELCAELGLAAQDTARTLALQQALSRAGYAVGAVDGTFGPATLAALTEFVADAGLPPLTGTIPPEALHLLGISDFTDANPDNNRACAGSEVPAAPLICDPLSTRDTGGACACRFEQMKRLSPTACACPKGQRLGKKGCEAAAVSGGKAKDSTGGSKPDGTAPACDPATTVLRGGVCKCRAASMVRLSDTACADLDLRLCPDGRPEIPGLPCAPAGPACSRVNAAGECCDDLPAGDSSCR